MSSFFFFFFFLLKWSLRWRVFLMHMLNERHEHYHSQNARLYGHSDPVGPWSLCPVVPIFVFAGYVSYSYQLSKWKKRCAFSNKDHESLHVNKCIHLIFCSSSWIIFYPSKNSLLHMFVWNWGSSCSNINKVVIWYEIGLLSKMATF